MKFAIRDDDLNFFSDPKKIEKAYSEIWNICPVSMSVIPFIKGNFPKWVEKLEKIGPGLIDEKLLRQYIADNKIYPIDQNKELVYFIKDKISEGKIYLTIHGIHHRNEDDIIPQFNNNFGIGAEFFTNRDLTVKLSNAIKYIENLFQQPIEIFTPPQNIMSNIGVDSVINNKLAIVGSYPPVKSSRTLRLLGFNEYVKYLIFKLRNRNIDYPYPLIGENLKVVNHYSLQPGTNLKELYRRLNQVYSFNGTFVISTHSYGFNYKMRNTDKTMGTIMYEIVEYVTKKTNIKFMNLKQVFE